MNWIRVNLNNLKVFDLLAAATRSLKRTVNTNVNFFIWASLYFESDVGSIGWEELKVVHLYSSSKSYFGWNEIEFT